MACPTVEFKPLEEAAAMYVCALHNDPCVRLEFVAFLRDKCLTLKSGPVVSAPIFVPA